VQAAPPDADAIRLELRLMKLKGGCRHCLVDATEFAVQSIEVTQALQALTDGFPRLPPSVSPALPVAS
jgi:hypothetical protein